MHKLSLTESEKRSLDLSGRIPGWGSDKDPARRPGVPRDKSPMLGVESLYPPITPQRRRIAVFRSTEHRKITPVFGTSSPPRGLSGVIRRFAYRYSEGRLSHWLLLMLGDRIDVVEGLIEDVARGRVPHVLREMGIHAELRFNRTGLARKLLAVGFGFLAFGTIRKLRRAI